MGNAVRSEVPFSQDLIRGQRLQHACGLSMRRLVPHRLWRRVFLTLHPSCRNERVPFLIRLLLLRVMSPVG